MKRLFSALLLVAIVGLGLFWWLTRPIMAVTGAQAAALEQGGDAGRGELVFNAGGCASCHATPGQPDRKRLGGGLQLKTAFGTFVAPNISPSQADGIGSWKTADLANAMLRGVSPDGAHYYPAFPYTTYAHAKPEDVRDLMAYLRTLPSVDGKAPAHELSFPFSFRRGIGLWKTVFLDTTPIRDEPGKSAEWNRGRYLVDALGHCAECHSPRNPAGGIVAAQRYAGGPDAEGRGWVPNITAKGIGSWSKGDVSELLATGFTPEYDSVGSSMADVVRNTGALPKADRDAMAEYLKSLPAVDGPPRPPKKD
ncbi:MAG: putative diheme cytochrome c-553 [Hyphomicrobiales bacterium]|nr:putative diheme cytochrome c-553 [Hyphomicrobiales bacterium]